MFKPRFICLDTASWGRLARTWKTDNAAQRVLSCFDSGAIIPFVTSSILEELVRHENDDTFAERVRFLRRLPFIAFPKLPEAPTFLGDTLEAREYEMAVLIDHPAAGCDEIIRKVRPNVTDGFSSGRELCERNLEWWRVYRRDFAQYLLARDADSASISHFFDPRLDPYMKLPEPGKYRVRSKIEIRRMLSERFQTLVKQLKQFGDQRLRDPGRRLASPEKMASSFLADIHQGILAIDHESGDFLENMLRSAGVERGRLPSEATIEDVAYEVTFVGSLRVHERRLSLPAGCLFQIARQESVPSWIVWREVHRAIKRIPKAEGSSQHDAMTVPFGLYVDALETDKRALEAVRQASTKHPAVQAIASRIFRSGDLNDLAGRIEALATRK